jgi:hypothetical protein
LEKFNNEEIEESWLNNPVKESDSIAKEDLQNGKDRMNRNSSSSHPHHQQATASRIRK